MNAYNEAFIKHVTEHPLKYFDVEMDSVLELFYRCYAEGRMKDSSKARECFLEILERFLEGFRVGGRWGMETRQI